jgi:hypothetical protein
MALCIVVPGTYLRGMRRGVAVLGSMTLALALTACGSDAKSNDVDAWTDAVCARMYQLDRDVIDERDDLDAKVADASDPDAVIGALRRYLRDVGELIGPAADDLAALGTPTISGGDDIRADLADAFDAVADDVDDLAGEVDDARSGASPAEADALLAAVGDVTNLDAEVLAVLTDSRRVAAVVEERASCVGWQSLVDSTATPSTSEPTTTTRPPITLPTPPSTTTTTTTSTTTTTAAPPPTTTPPTTLPPTVPPTEAPTAPPVTVDPYAVARDAYLAAADEFDVRSDAIYDYYFGDDGYLLYTDAPAYCAESAALERDWASRMAGITWPADVQWALDGHLAASQALTDLFDLCAAAPGDDGQEPILTAIDTEWDVYYTALDQLRVAIGLDPLAS